MVLISSNNINIEIYIFKVIYFVEHVRLNQSVNIYKSRVSYGFVNLLLLLKRKR